jgi:hypothetical protein
MGIEREQMQAEGIENTFNKILPESSLNFEKKVIIQVQEALEH